MTKRDYELIAKVIRETTMATVDCHPVTRKTLNIIRENLIKSFSTELYAENPTFPADRFRSVCCEDTV